MTQVDDLSRSLAVFDQNTSLIVVVELSEASWLIAGLVALLHGSAVEPGEASEQFQQDTFGAGDAQLIRARNNSEKSLDPK